MKTDSIADHEFADFIAGNRITVNGYLNKVMWCFVATGPALVWGIKGGVFNNIEYATCLYISLTVVVLSFIHMMLRKFIPDSVFTGLFALTSLDMLIVYMSVSHVAIHLTWFLVPLLSLLFCDKIVYAYAVALNYVLMVAATWYSSEFLSSFSTRFDSQRAYFLNEIGGFTIETLIMLISGYTIVKLAGDYFRELFRQNKVIIEKDKSMKEKMDILDSMVEIYDNVNLISFVDSTEMSLRSEAQEKHGIDMTTQTHTLMNQRIKNQIMPDQLDAFLTFTNIKTVRSRLSQKKIISADFIDVVSGWFRAQYITVDATVDGIPNTVIYVTRNVDEEKRREEHLVRISMTDEMTRLYNRRCYDEDLIELRENALPEQFVIFSVDVNGLKTVNDTKGHAAGDELIKGAADCLALTIGNHGKVYRTGGDEFMAVVYTDDPEELRNAIHARAAGWHGIYCEKISVSIGYAAYASDSEATIDDLERRADADMYAEKESYYRKNGIDRRT